MTANEIKLLAARYGFTPTKLRGQHFLVDSKVYADILSSAELTRSDVVLEVGPGFGTLTRELALLAGRVVAVELDRRFEPAIKETLGDLRNVEVVWGDVMRTPLSISPLPHRGEKQKKFPPPSGKGEDEGGGFKIVSNLPYQITSPFLWKFLDPPKTGDDTLARSAQSVITGFEGPERLVLLLQREVAERIVAKPPRMNLLALLVQTFGKAEIIRRVPPGAFWPPPRVESAVVRITRTVRVPPELRKVILTLAKKAFDFPRKKLSSTLPRYPPLNLPPAAQGGEKERGISAVLRNCGIDPNNRPERLSLDDWLCIGRSAANSV